MKSVLFFVASLVRYLIDVVSQVGGYAEVIGGKGGFVSRRSLFGKFWILFFFLISFLPGFTWRFHCCLRLFGWC